ncbi:piggyBac transposable element-derived protein 3-like [Rhopalosiphum padi]|uniref:piggyBac transposable element-derived protein 3-like n=1 Tax=Rhopalosiphum padi TaxID=40932 RepID=UPI00298EC7D4|nr:piggyBac transposable element-derived protein 3-like [Rhopalosiphum padi]
MSKLTHTDIIDLLDGNISELSDLESNTDSVGEIDELLDNFDENEIFELLDYNDIENVNYFPEVDVPGWFTIEKKNMKWEQKPFTPPKINLNEIEQSDCPDEIQSPLYYFSKYFDDSDFENMSFFTNLYGVQKNTNNFKPTNTQEMKEFVAIHLMMGVLKFPRIRMYWENNTRIHIIANTMNRNRFFSIRSHFHVINNMDIPTNNHDKFIKVRPLYDRIKKACLKLRTEKYLSVDEQIVPFKGHLSVKQYIRGKPNPWGIKIFLLCGQSGIVYNILLYQGFMPEVSEESRKIFGLGGAVVLYLSDHLQCNRHYLTMDNFFTSINLMYTLQKKEIYATGTIRANRFCNPPFVSDKIMKNLGRGTTFEISSNVPDINIGLVKWYDNKPIYLCSNIVTSGEVDKVKRWDRKKKEYVYIERPEIVRHYNKTMGGVDKHDQLVSFYRCFIKSKKWTLRMVSHAFDMAVSNSWLEYVEDAKKLKVPKKEIMDLLNFRMRLAEELIYVGKTVNPPSKKKGRPTNTPSPVAKKKLYSETQKMMLVDSRPTTSVQHDSINHLPNYDGRKESTRCKNTGCKGRTHVYCNKCNVHLCFTSKSNCFSVFHVK